MLAMHGMVLSSDSGVDPIDAGIGIQGVQACGNSYVHCTGIPCYSELFTYKHLPI